MASCNLLLRICSWISIESSGYKLNVFRMAESKPRARAPTKTPSVPKKMVRSLFKQATPSSKSPLVYFNPQKVGISLSAKSQKRGMETVRKNRIGEYHENRTRAVCQDQLTANASEHWDVVVEQWSGWAVLGDFLQVLDQVFFDGWAEEQIRQAEDSINAKAFSMDSHFVDIGNRCTADLDHAYHLILTACLEPFFGETNTLFQFQSGALADGAIDDDAVQALLLEPRGIFLDDIVVDGAFPTNKITECSIQLLHHEPSKISPKLSGTYLSSVNEVNTGANKPLKLNWTDFILNGFLFFSTEKN